MSEFMETIEKLKTQIGSHVATLKEADGWSQVEKLFRALGTIEELAEVPKTTLADLFGFADEKAGVVVKPGEWIGMEGLDAAKLYLDKRGVAASLDEIMEAIQMGGANNVNRNDLRTSLARSTWDVVKAHGQELYTLLKYAPHVKRGKKKSQQAQANGTVEETKEKEPAENPEPA